MSLNSLSLPILVHIKMHGLCIESLICCPFIMTIIKYGVLEECAGRKTRNLKLEEKNKERKKMREIKITLQKGK